MAVNMSYCEMENTYLALRECNDSLSVKDVSDLSEREQAYAKKLFKLCAQIADDYFEE